MFRHLIPLLALALSGVLPTAAQQRRVIPAPKAAAASAAAFVQKFYDWYVPFAEKEHAEASSELARKRRAALFSGELRRRLAEDMAAQAKVPDEIVGLDFDPFLNAQDIVGRYVVKRTTRKGPNYRVEVHTVTKGETSPAPAVVPEVAPSGKSWVFVNFHYPDPEKPAQKSDLLGILKELRASRRKGGR